MKNLQFDILELSKNLTENGKSTCWSIKCMSNETGEILDAVYFGNTKPTKVVSIESVKTKSGKEYNIAHIQPHTSRDKVTGRFKCGYRT